MQGLLVGAPAEVAAAAEMPATLLQAFAQRRASSAAAHAPLPTVPPPASALACRGLSGAGAAAAHAASLPAKPTKPLHAKPTKPTTSSRAAKEAPQSQAAQRRSRRLAESQQQQQEGSLVARISLGPSPGPSRERPSAGDRTGQRSATKAAAPAGAVRAAGAHAWSQVGKPASTGSGSAVPCQLLSPSVASLRPPCCRASWPQLQVATRAPLATSATPSSASFGRKRQRSGQAEAMGPAPLGKQQQQEQVAKRQRQAPGPPEGRPPVAMRPASRQPGSQPRTAGHSLAAQRPAPTSQAEALFDSLFGGPEAAETDTPARDLAAAVQRQLARNVARHARRVAQSRQQHARGGGAVWLSQPVEDDSCCA